MRMNNLHVLQAARFSNGPRARCNDDEGKPNVEPSLPAGEVGQLVYPGLFGPACLTAGKVIMTFGAGWPVVYSVLTDCRVLLPSGR